MWHNFPSYRWVAQQHEELDIFSYCSESLLAKETHRAVKTATSPKSCKWRLVWLQGTATKLQTKSQTSSIEECQQEILHHIFFFAISQVFCSSFWHHLQIQDMSINFTSILEVCQQPAAPAEPPLLSEEPRDAGGAAAAALRAAGRCQSIRQAGRAGWAEERSYQCQPSLQGAWHNKRDVLETLLARQL